VAGGNGYVIYIQAEEDRENQSPLCHASPHMTVREGSRFGRTLRTSDFAGRIEWFSPGKRGILGP
jgi:hypothetical protein